MLWIIKYMYVCETKPTRQHIYSPKSKQEKENENINNILKRSDSIAVLWRINVKNLSV